MPTKTPLEAVLLEGKPNAAALMFRGAYTVPLKTKNGTVHLGLAQSLECIEEKGVSAQERFLLKTRQYWYRIQLQEGQGSAAIIRWEYISPTLPAYRDTGKRWCWRHIQMPMTVGLPKGVVDLDKAHLPSGYVVIEDVIRFLITDLGVKPPCGSAWHKKLVDSEKRCFREFNVR